MDICSSDVSVIFWVGLGIAEILSMYTVYIDP